MMRTPVYFDNNATTPLSDVAFEAMLPYLKNQYGNPSSIHSLGRSAKQAIQKAKEQIADCVNASVDDVYFTSGGTAANNWVLRGQDWQDGDILVHSAVEHEAVVQAAVSLVVDQKKDILIKSLMTDENAVVSLEQLKSVSAPRLVSVMAANNEVGSLSDIAQISAWAKSQGSLMHTDAVQALGKVSLDFDALGLDFMSLSAHKIGGPKGIGALIAKSGILKPLFYGGGQEFGMVSGTENVPAIVGFGAVCEDVKLNLGARQNHLTLLQASLEEGLSTMPVQILGQGAKRLCNTTLFAVKDSLAETLVLRLDKAGFCVSTGSACASSKGEPSHVVRALSLSSDYQQGVIRVSFGIQNTLQEVQEFLQVIQSLIDN